MKTFVGSAGHQNGFFATEDGHLLKSFQPDSEFEISILNFLKGWVDDILQGQLVIFLDRKWDSIEY